MKKVFAVSILAILATGAANAQIASQAYVDKVTEDMATETWVEAQGYLTEHQDLGDYAKSAEVTQEINSAVSGAKSDLESKINAKADAADLSKYQTVANMNSTTTLSTTSTTTYASEKTVADAISAAVTGITGGDIKDLQEDVEDLQGSVADLESSKADKTDLSKYQTTEAAAADKAGLQSQIDGKQGKLTAGNAIDAEKLAAGTVAVTDGTFVTPGSLTTALTPYETIEGAAGKYQTKTDAQADAKALEDFKTEVSGTYATQQALTTGLAGKVDNSAITDMATQTWVEGKKYLTEHQSLTEYVKGADMNLTKTGGDNMYIKSVTQTNGKVTAETSNLATDVAGAGFAKTTEVETAIQTAIKEVTDGDLSELQSEVAGLKENKADKTALNDYQTKTAAAADKSELEGKITAADTKAGNAATAAQAAQNTADAAKTTAEAAIPKPDPNTCTDATDGCVLKFINNNYSWEPIAGAGDVQQ